MIWRKKQHDVFNWTYRVVCAEIIHENRIAIIDKIIETDLH